MEKSDKGSSFTDKAIHRIFSSFIKTLILWAKKSPIIHVFAHNFAGFDGILLLKHLLPYGEVKPIFHNGRLMSVNLHIRAWKIIKSDLGLPIKIKNILVFPDGTNLLIEKDLIIKFKDSLLFLPAPP